MELSDVITMMLFDEVFCVCRIKIKMEIKIVIKNFWEVNFCRNVTCNNPNSYFFFLRRVTVVISF